MTKKSRKRRPSPASAAAAPAAGAVPSATAFLIATAAFILCASYSMPFMPDDSFISFRYAQHLADGHGLTFNVGDSPVEGYSNLLWILICAGLYKIGVRLPQVTPGIGLLLGIASLYVLWSLCRRRAPHWTQQLLPLLALASCGPVVIHTVSGMETALFGVLLLLVVRLAEDLVDSPGRHTLVAFTAVAWLASLARPEGVLAFPLAAGALLWDSRRDQRFRRLARSLGFAALAFGAATVVYHIWRVSYFGEWLPTPFMSKGAGGASLLSGWRMNADHYFLNWGYAAPPQGYLFAALLMLSFAGLRAAQGAGRRSAGDFVAFVLGAALGAVYINFVDWMPGMRYHAPLIGVLLVCTRNLHRLLPESSWRAAAGRGLRRFAVMSLLLFLAMSVGLSHLRHADARIADSSRLCNVPLGNWLHATLPPGSLVAIGDVGMIPYYSGLRTLDINPESLTDSYIAKRSFSAAYVLGKRPEALVLSVRGVFSARMDPLHWELYTSTAFRDEYSFIGTVRDQWYEDRSYWVYLRNGLTSTENQLKALPAGIGGQRRTRFDS